MSWVRPKELVLNMLAVKLPAPITGTAGFGLQGDNGKAGKEWTHCLLSMRHFA